MWTPSDNIEEGIEPSGSRRVGTTISVSLQLPPSEGPGEFKLRVMDDADFSAGDESRARTSLALIDAVRDDRTLSGTVTIPNSWSGRTIRVGFVPADGAERGYGGADTITIP
ncbi:MAG: hypothetical protein IPK80_17555 [Nannocystis sp.]|nr:hypothetical protein [Nannocystis sp.]